VKVLKIDLDFWPPRPWLNLWKSTREDMLQRLGYFTVSMHTFPTKRGLHIYITLDRHVAPEVGNMLQFLCGDDHTRVKINQWRIARGIKWWNKLFHKVLYRRKAKVIECWYCGNKIPVRD